jgi:hypothetical protein
MALASSIAQKGKPRWSDEDKKRISRSLMGNTYCLGRTLSDDHKNNISVASKGHQPKPVSEETRAKMSASAKARHERERATP